VQLFLPGFDIRGCQSLFRNQNIQTCRALDSRPAGDFQKPAPVPARPLTIALSNVQQNARRCAVELVFDRRLVRTTLEKSIGPRYESDGLLVNFQFLMIEHRVHRCWVSKSKRMSMR